MEMISLGNMSRSLLMEQSQKSLRQSKIPDFSAAKKSKIMTLRFCFKNVL